MRKLSLEDGWGTKEVKETLFFLSYASHVHGTKVPEQKSLRFLTTSLSCSGVVGDGCVT